MKEINCTFMMSGTYYLDENSVHAARLKAMGSLPLPEDRDYISDSLTVDGLDECMIANGWSYEEVEDLSKLSAEILIKTLDTQHNLGLETSPNSPYTSTRLKEFLLDYYGIEYNPAKKDEA